MKLRWAPSAGVLLVLFAAVGCSGRYQQTLDRNAFVWNDKPMAGRIATWSGTRDSHGYATGYGTLTWYAPQKAAPKGFSIFRRRDYTPVVSESGTMVRGRLERAAAIDMPAMPPSSMVKQSPLRTGAEDATSRSATRIRQQGRIGSPISPREPLPPAGQDIPAEGRVAEANGTNSSTEATPHTHSSNSLRSLTNPPASLGLQQSLGTSSQPPEVQRSNAGQHHGSPQLQRSEAIELANAEARAHGYDLDAYEWSKTQYDAANGSWAVVYKPKLPHTADAQEFAVTVDDETKKAAIGIGKD